MVGPNTSYDDFDEDDPEEDFDENFDEGDPDAWLEEIDQPGPEHRRLDALVGEWHTTIKLWDDGPDEKPLEFQGSVRRQWMLNGRFLAEQRSENPTESAYRSLSFIGYNRMTALYEYVRMNTESTCMYFESGRFDPTTNVIRTSGSHTDPATGFVTQNRTEIEISGPDSHTVVSYATEEDGREYKLIEIIHIRKNK